TNRRLERECSLNGFRTEQNARRWKRFAEWSFVQEFRNLLMWRNREASFTEVIPVYIGEVDRNDRRNISRIGNGDSGIDRTLHRGVDSQFVDERRQRNRCLRYNRAILTVSVNHHS